MTFWVSPNNSFELLVYVMTANMIRQKDTHFTSIIFPGHFLLYKWTDMFEYHLGHVIQNKINENGGMHMTTSIL